MRFYRFIVLILCAGSGCLCGQLQPNWPYLEKDILDSVEGIQMYSRFIGALTSDSVTCHRNGSNLQGWNEDFYKSGKLLHRGYYVNGKLITFKNFYESGQCERMVENPDPLHCNVNIFFENGSPRRLIYYYNGLPQRFYEFYENGLPKYTEENEKELNYLKLKKSWYGNGNLESSLELLDHAGKKYAKKNYYLNGQLREEGILLKLPGVNEYVKEGSWYSYDSSGKKSRPENH
jgi:antitoxin component YwqK of YwqJK toxin-antitoxin module